jgi:hypothetical protein
VWLPADSEVVTELAHRGVLGCSTNVVHFAMKFGGPGADISMRD